MAPRVCIILIVDWRHQLIEQANQRDLIGHGGRNVINTIAELKVRIAVSMIARRRACLLRYGVAGRADHTTCRRMLYNTYLSCCG